MNIPITKNQRDLILGLNAKVTAAMANFQVAQAAAHAAHQQYEQADQAMKSVLSCFAMDGDPSLKQIGPSKVLDGDDGKFFLVFEDAPLEPGTPSN